MFIGVDFILKETHFATPKKIGFTLKVFFKETFFIIPQIPIYTKGVLNFNLIFNFHLQQFHKF